METSISWEDFVDQAKTFTDYEIEWWSARSRKQEAVFTGIEVVKNHLYISWTKDKVDWQPEPIEMETNQVYLCEDGSYKIVSIKPSHGIDFQVTFRPIKHAA